jgi:hypothetical protein
MLSITATGDPVAPGNRGHLRQAKRAYDAAAAQSEAARRIDPANAAYDRDLIKTTDTAWGRRRGVL